MTPGRPAPSVVYIGGAGRSGSTLLDNLLGSSAGWFSTGELRLLWGARQLWTHRCGCGRPLRECPLWTTVLERLGDVDLEWAADMERRLLRSRRTWRLVRATGVRAVPGGERFAELTRWLAVAITDVTGDHIVVDSSKSPMGVALWSAAGVDVVAVHLVRDPRATAWSWRRSGVAAETTPFARRTVAGTAGEWLVNNAAMDAVTRRASVSCVRIRYEDLVDDPATTLARIASRAGAPLVPCLGGPTAALAPNHTVAGNPSRFRSGTVTLRCDDEWRERLSLRDRLLTTAVTAPLLTRYGYPLRTR